MVGSWYFMRTNSDWAYTSAYGYLQKSYLDSIAKAGGVDLEKAEVLEAYIESLEEKISMMSPQFKKEHWEMFVFNQE